MVAKRRIEDAKNVNPRVLCLYSVDGRDFRVVVANEEDRRHLAVYIEEKRTDRLGEPVWHDMSEATSLYVHLYAAVMSVQGLTPSSF